MKILKIFFYGGTVIIALCVAATVVAGLLIPAEQSFVNAVEINAPSEKVWEVITDRERYAEWQPQLGKVEISGDGTWVEYPKDSPEPLLFSLAKDSRPDSMEFAYAMGDHFRGHWKGVIEPSATGVKLTTTDSYKVDGWLTKILIYAFFDLDSFAQKWNGQLKDRVESLRKQ